MKILLLGSNGQLGTDIRKAAEARDDVDLLAWTRSDLDVENSDAIGPTLGGQEFDVLVNCTSYHKTDEVERDGTRAVAVNAHAVQAMAEACAEKGARFVHFSTDYVFSGDKGVSYTEADCPAPINVYGATKYLGETLARRAHTDTLVLRVASLFGHAGSSGKGGNFVETMLRLEKERNEISVVSDIAMSPTSTASVARMVFQLLQAGAPPGLYHAVLTGQATWYEFAEEIFSQIGARVRLIPVTSAEYSSVALRPALSVLDNSRITKIIGRVPSWREALAEYLLARPVAE